MTPKEKAKELVWKYYHQIEHTMSNEYSDKCWELSKQCLLIAVNEILKENLELPDEPETVIRYLFWQEVKKEIEAL